MLLGARVRGLAVLCVQSYSRLDLLFYLRLDFWRLPCLFDFRGTPRRR